MDEIMRTLDRWADRLLQLPCTIECPRMEILGYDHEEPIFTGTGSIFIRSQTEMQFVMQATPREGAEAFSRYLSARNNRFETLEQFRVTAVDCDGTEWNCGYVELQIGGTFTSTWRLSGEVARIVSRICDDSVSAHSDIEVIYDSELRLSMC